MLEEKLMCTTNHHFMATQLLAPLHYVAEHAYGELAVTPP